MGLQVSVGRQHRPRASAVMTVCADQRFPDTAVNGTLVHEFENLELIIVDDASGREAFDALKHRAPRIRVRTSQTNPCMAAANRGIEADRGDIVLRLDTDDAAQLAHTGDWRRHSMTTASSAWWEAP